MALMLGFAVTGFDVDAAKIAHIIAKRGLPMENMVKV